MNWPLTLALLALVLFVGFGTGFFQSQYRKSDTDDTHEQKLRS